MNAAKATLLGGLVDWARAPFEGAVEDKIGEAVGAAAVWFVPSGAVTVWPVPVRACTALTPTSWRCFKPGNVARRPKECFPSMIRGGDAGLPMVARTAPASGKHGLHQPVPVVMHPGFELAAAGVGEPPIATAAVTAGPDVERASPKSRPCCEGPCVCGQLMLSLLLPPAAGDAGPDVGRASPKSRACCEGPCICGQLMLSLLMPPAAGAATSSSMSSSGRRSFSIELVIPIVAMGWEDANGVVGW